MIPRAASLSDNCAPEGQPTPAHACPGGSFHLRVMGLPELGKITVKWGLNSGPSLKPLHTTGVLMFEVFQGKCPRLGSHNCERRQPLGQLIVVVFLVRCKDRPRLLPS